jgi:lysophospholipase L1-like esterase
MHDQSFVDMTEKLLQKRFPGVNVECINAGVPGYTMVQGWRYIEAYGLAYEPDLIIAQFGWNDAKIWTPRDDLETYEDRKRATPPSILAGSEMCRQLWYRIHHPALRAEPVPRVNSYEYGLMLDRIQQAVERQGVEFLPLVWPILKNFEIPDDTQLSDYQRVTYDWGRKAAPFGPDARAGFIDLIPAMSSMAGQPAGRKKVFMDGVHTWPEGNEIIAAAIADYISPWFADKASQLHHY